MPYKADLIFFSSVIKKILRIQTKTDVIKHASTFIREEFLSYYVDNDFPRKGVWA